MTEVLNYDVVIIGSGIAGLLAAIEAARVSKGTCRVAVITKVQASMGSGGVTLPGHAASCVPRAWILRSLFKD